MNMALCRLYPFTFPTSAAPPSGPLLRSHNVPICYDIFALPMESPWNSNELGRLIEKCKANDARAWSRLVDQFQAMVYSIAKRSGLSPDDCEDVFVSTFQILLRSMDRIESPGALPRWIAVTASREALRVKRISLKSTDYESAGLTLDEVVAHEEVDAEQMAIEANQAASLRAFVAKIDEKCRKLLQVLYFEGDQSYTEVSRIVGIPIGAIGPTRARCLEKLRVVLKKESFFQN